MRLEEMESKVTESLIRGPVEETVRVRTKEGPTGTLLVETAEGETFEVTTEKK